MAISGRSRVRTELFELVVVSALAPHPVQMHRQFARHRYFRDLPPAPHGEVKEPTAPLGLAAHGDLRRFHQQKQRRYFEGTTATASISIRNSGRNNLET
jgi:hypothetical protein